MGLQEQRFKRKLKRQNLQHVILATVSITGLMAIAAVAPNALQCLKIFGFDPKKRQRETMLASRDRLIKNGFLAYKNGFVTLAPRGKRRLLELDLKDWQIEKPKRWDGKWRLLAFDIPEKKRGLRNKVRLTLINIGFLRLQNSVWIYPYDCEDLINLLKADFKIGRDLLYIIVDSIENDKNFRLAFDLPEPL